MSHTTFKNPTNYNEDISLEEKIDWLRLLRSQSVSRNVFFRLIELFGSAKNALENVAEQSIKGGRDKPIVLLPTNKAELELENCRKIGAEILIFKDHLYPKLLREIPDAPPIITVRGNLNLLNSKILAVVGPRNASYNGCRFAKIIARDLGEKGFTIASGLARGVDSAAHIGSMATGTIAVIAGGIDHIYPKENEDLYHEIAKKGLIISETPFGVAPKGGNFPQRNRIISGLSYGVVIVEATLRSGTLITARFAIEQNREVFAVPGSPFDPRSQGTNRLIKEGAKMIENIDDIVGELTLIDNWQEESKMMEPDLPEFSGFGSSDFLVRSEENIDLARKEILSKISYDPTAIDNIISLLEIPARIANVALVQLELAEKIEYQNGKVCLKAETLF